MDPLPTTPPSGALPEAIRAFLAEPRYATLATTSADGAPHQAVIWYALDGDDLMINSRRERKWPRNLLRHDRLSLAVMDRERPTHWVGVKGRAELLRDGPPAIDDIKALARRYDDDDGSRFEGQDRVTYRVVVESTFEYGND